MLASELKFSQRRPLSPKELGGTEVISSIMEVKRYKLCIFAYKFLSKKLVYKQPSTRHPKIYENFRTKKVEGQQKIGILAKQFHRRKIVFFVIKMGAVHRLLIYNPI